MAATRADVDRWIENGKVNGATHILSVCDTFDHDDYPIYVMPTDSLIEVKAKYDGKNMQKVNEVITLNPDGTVDEQI